MIFSGITLCAPLGIPPVIYLRNPSSIQYRYLLKIPPVILPNFPWTFFFKISKEISPSTAADGFQHIPALLIEFRRTWDSEISCYSAEFSMDYF